MVGPIRYSKNRPSKSTTPPLSPASLTSTWTALSNAVFNERNGYCDGNSSSTIQLKSLLISSQVRGRLSIVRKARSMLPRRASPLACKRLNYLERDLCSLKQIASDCKHRAFSALRRKKRPRISKLNLAFVSQTRTVDQST